MWAGSRLSTRSSAHHGEAEDERPRPVPFSETTTKASRRFRLKPSRCARGIRAYNPASPNDPHPRHATIVCPRPAPSAVCADWCTCDRSSAISDASCCRTRSRCQRLTTRSTATAPSWIHVSTSGFSDWAGRSPRWRQSCAPRTSSEARVTDSGLGYGSYNYPFPPCSTGPTSAAPVASPSDSAAACRSTPAGTQIWERRLRHVVKVEPVDERQPPRPRSRVWCGLGAEADDREAVKASVATTASACVAVQLAAPAATPGAVLPAQTPAIAPRDSRSSAVPAADVRSSRLASSAGRFVVIAPPVCSALDRGPGLGRVG